MSSNIGGHRFVLGLYAVLVAVAGAAGYLTGVLVSGLSTSRFLSLVPFPPTPTGFVAYGVPTITLVFGVPLALVVYVSTGLDDMV